MSNHHKRSNSCLRLRGNPSFSFLEQGITVYRVKKGMRGILSFLSKEIKAIFPFKFRSRVPFLIDSIKLSTKI